MSGFTVRRLMTTSALAALVFCSAARVVSAENFISPFIGYNFGGDAGCPEISNCENKTRNLGVSFGSIGSVMGAELEFSFVDNFFGETPGTSSNVLTLMGNVMIAPKFGIVQPYGVAGLGLIKTHAEITATSLLESTNNHFGWDLGGGMIVYVGSHVGLRGDIRYFHAFQDLDLLGLSLGTTKLDFGRVAGAILFRF